MRRRVVATSLTILFTAFLSAHQSAAKRQVAITFDDLPGASVGRGDLEYFERFTTELLAALACHQVPAIGFVNEGKVVSNGAVVPARVALLKQWADAGLELGNHSYSHGDLHSMPSRSSRRTSFAASRSPND